MVETGLGEAVELGRYWEFRTRGSVAWSYPDSSSVTVLGRALERDVGPALGLANTEEEENDQGCWL